MRGSFGHCQLGPRLSRVVSSATGVGWTTHDHTGASFRNCYRLCASAILCKIPFAPSLQRFTTDIHPGILWEGSSHAALLRKLEIALKDGCIHEAWEAFSNFKRLHGFPQHHMVNRMIVLLSYSSNPPWLCRAYDLVLIILKEKPGLLHYDSLTRLALTLARTQMSIPASTVLRIMLEKGKFPPSDIWSTLFSHLVKSQVGSYLASDILIEICGFLVLHNSDTRSSKQTKLKKPNTTIFNLVLDSCLRFRSILKAQQIIEMMALTGAVADANSINLIARVFEMTGQRDELKKLRGHIDGVSSVILNRHYRQFYDSLLSLHFKYNDIDAAAELVFDLYRLPKSLQSSSVLFSTSNGLHKHCLVQIGSSNLRMGSKIIAEPEKLQNDFVVAAQSRSRLVHFVDGKLVPSDTALARLINGYVKERKVGKLSNLLISVKEETGLKVAGLSSDVMDACVQLGWLETAHDILDDLEAAAIPIGANTYTSLLRAYCKENKLGECKVLLKQMRKAGVCELTGINLWFVYLPFKEIITGAGHTSAVDWWALGILLYEMLYGYTPFRGKTRQKTFANILQKDLKFPGSTPVSLPAKQLMYRLLHRDSSNRLGSCEGANEIKQHPFFRGINWALVRCMSLPKLDAPLFETEIEKDAKPMDADLANIPTDLF